MNKNNKEKSRTPATSTLFVREYGKPMPINISKVLLPIAFDIAMSPYPRRAACMDVNKSGREVPMAITIRENTASDSPSIEVISTVSFIKKLVEMNITSNDVIT